MIKQPKLTKDSTSKSKLTRVSVLSAFGALNPAPPAYEVSASSKCIGSHLSVINDLASLSRCQSYLESG